MKYDYDNMYVYRSSTSAECLAWDQSVQFVTEKSKTDDYIETGEIVNLLSVWYQQEREFTPYGVVAYEVKYAKVKVLSTNKVFIVRWNDWDGNVGWEKVEENIDERSA